MLRIVLFGWLFVLMVGATWIGLLAPAPVTGSAGGDTFADAPSAVETLTQVGHRNQGLDLPPAGTPGSCPILVAEGPWFGPNQVKLDARGETVLMTTMATLIEMGCITDPDGRSCGGPQAEIAVEGHSDELPSSHPGGNQQVSHDRARSVADWLTAAGFTIRSVEGLGASQPAPGPDPDTRSPAQRQADDRRVTLRAWCPRP
jgi:outer membrane protein OmpA-like peptidoglycan-associated protein